MPYTEPPAIQSGQLWTVTEVDLYILENIRDLHARGQVAPVLPTDPNRVVITDGNGDLTGFQLQSGDLIVGGAGGIPTRLPIGADGTVLGVMDGTVQYVRTDELLADYDPFILAVYS